MSNYVIYFILFKIITYRAVIWKMFKSKEKWAKNVKQYL